MTMVIFQIFVSASVVWLFMNLIIFALSQFEQVPLDLNRAEFKRVTFLKTYFFLNLKHSQYLVLIILLFGIIYM